MTEQEMIEIKCHVNFNYDRSVPAWLKKEANHDYMILRNLACEELNRHLEAWNEEFRNIDNVSDDVSDDDELKDFGGTKYCEFIRNKQTPIIDEINRRYAHGIVKLYSTIECDVGGILFSPFTKKEIARFYITLELIK